MTDSSRRPSLLVVSLPRSLSTQTWQWARTMLGLEAPEWASDGELLNLDRFHFAEPALGARHFLRPDDGSAFHGALALLDRMVAPRGYAYKDVTQPFVVARWLETARPEGRCHVLRLRRSLTDVVYAMLDQGWTYPSRVASEVADPRDALIDGLLLAREALDAIEAPTVDYDDLIGDEEALRRPLAELYGVERPTQQWLDLGFTMHRDMVLARRHSARYRELDERVRAREARRREPA